LTESQVNLCGKSSLNNHYKANTIKSRCLISAAQLESIVLEEKQSKKKKEKTQASGSQASLLSDFNSFVL